MSDQPTNAPETSDQDAPAAVEAEAPAPNVAVRPVAFGPLQPAAEAPQGGASPSLDLILDVRVPVVVELGRAELCIEDLIALQPGSVVQLEKLASEPVELLIRDHVVAQGEVVVIDDNFGLRITGIVDPNERVRNLG